MFIICANYTSNEWNTYIQLYVWYQKWITDNFTFQLHLSSGEGIRSGILRWLCIIWRTETRDATVYMRWMWLHVSRLSVYKTRKVVKTTITTTSTTTSHPIRYYWKDKTKNPRESLHINKSHVQKTAPVAASSGSVTCSFTPQTNDRHDDKKTQVINKQCAGKTKYLRQHRQETRNDRI